MEELFLQQTEAGVVPTFNFMHFLLHYFLFPAAYFEFLWKALQTEFKISFNSN